ncbi:hypothetical protein [Halogranum rubrum]|uniref:Uncharacterized protein n=1 Tax=Halogranum salarium B-1 TaxID=1210908 RepID=J3EZF3_9EURY|nr:hypothetical protein [Halogranum salarium]EJN60972.1 hypothetical protein HSB1_15750 [Halogranum salarium B-1]
MNGRYAAVGVALLVVVAGGIVGVLSTGDGPVDVVDSVLGNDSASDDAGTGDADGGSTDGGDGGSGGGDAASDGGSTSEPETEFAFAVRNIENCGQTCRDVTVELTNTMDSPATDVEVNTRITTDGDEIWSASESFDEVDDGASKTETKRVKLGYFDAAKVKQNGGTIRIKTTVAWDGGEQTFSETRKVA